MKKLFFFIVITSVIACNENADERSVHADSTHNDHSRQDSSAPRSMYQLMQENMHQMMMAKSSDIADFDFAALMKIHHQGAIDMAKLELEQGKDSTVRRIAQKIIQDQQKEIAIFEVVPTIKLEQERNPAFFKKSMQSMHQMTLTDKKSFVDKEFIQMMIPHHEGAITMAKIYLDNGANFQELKKVAKSIIKTQQAEIESFKHLLTDMKY
jgi:uncharacterized protein (DUF305 family)